MGFYKDFVQNKACLDSPHNAYPKEVGVVSFLEFGPQVKNDLQINFAYITDHSILQFDWLSEFETVTREKGIV